MWDSRSLNFITFSEIHENSYTHLDKIEIQINKFRPYFYNNFNNYCFIRKFDKITFNLYKCFIFYGHKPTVLGAKWSCDIKIHKHLTRSIILIFQKSYLSCQMHSGNTVSPNASFNSFVCVCWFFLCAVVLDFVLINVSYIKHR